ncbi:hypothetical protein BST81_19955 [Leptolyngbya sp. 'hensonii']|uniref:hypothetical protein n=1 Tax=Leptolyngbya sp. 'hensonii' TaxID=1922337 RepID=UPI00094FBBA0|nr:hypothetical protein [Leptolyngbya sp. 'hensonii']OLP16712.1 hypothetical protein BST81_19955 [Leptolyngbya sp. 'hensonii']
MKKCPCCSQVLLRHIRQNGPYWFCTHCRQEMPDLISIRSLMMEAKLSTKHPALLNLLGS